MQNTPLLQRGASLREVQDFWEGCHKNFSHIEISGHLISYENLVTEWKKNFVDRLTWKDKVVVDYGIGGGYLGKYLFENHNIKKYYGVDIAYRSIGASYINLKKYDMELFYEKEYYETFNTKCDVFVSQACIQHFVDQEYFEKFLKKINDIEHDTVMLQIAFSPTTTFIKDNKYETVHNIVRACYTNKNFILKFLTKYENIYESDIAPNKYQFLIFKLK